jgi:pimeloyl-ACP methyl ester carboxylesterase
MPYLRPDLPRAVAADIVKHTWRSFTSSLWEVIYSGNVLQAVEALDAHIPVLCLHGDHDPVAPLDGVLTLAGQRRNWRVQVLPGVGHHPLFSEPDICLRAIGAIGIEDVVSTSINMPLSIIPTEEQAAA